MELLLQHVGPLTPLERLTPSRIAQILDAAARGHRKRKDGTIRPLSGNTIRKLASTLSQAIELARGVPPRLPEIPYRYRPCTDYLERNEYERVRNELPPHRRLWFVLAVWTGQRHSDVERMRREDFNPDEGWVMIRSTKTKLGPRRFHAAPELCSELAHHWRKLPPRARLVASWAHAGSQLSYLAGRFGMRPLTPQRLRHTFFSWYVAANGFTAELLELGGWRDMTIPSMVYAHASPKRLQEQIERTHALALGPRLAPRKTGESQSGTTAFSAVEKDCGVEGAEIPPTPLPVQEGPNPPGQDEIVARPVVVGEPVGAEGIEPSTNGLRARLFPPPDLVSAPAVGPPAFPRRDHHAECEEATARA